MWKFSKYVNSWYHRINYDFMEALDSLCTPKFFLTNETEIRHPSHKDWFFSQSMKDSKGFSIQWRLKNQASFTYKKNQKYKIHFYLSLLLVKTAKWGLSKRSSTMVSFLSMIPFFVCLSIKETRQKQIPNFNVRLFNLMALVASSNLLPMMEICWPLTRFFARLKELYVESYGLHTFRHQKWEAPLFLKLLTQKIRGQQLQAGACYYVQ